MEKEFHKVANALSYEYCFAHSYSRLVCEKYNYRKYVLFWYAYLLFYIHVCLVVSAYLLVIKHKINCAKMAEPIEILFGM